MAKCAKDINEQSPWQELTPGGEIYEGGTARMTITGEWRTSRSGTRRSASSVCCALRSARTPPSR